MGGAYSGFSISIIYSFIFAFFYFNNPIHPKKLSNQISIIYKFYLFALVLELIMNYSLGYQFLANLFPGSVGIEGYRLLSSRIVEANFNIPITGMNSLITGPQASSILSLTIIIWFGKIFKHEESKGKNIYFIISSVFFFLFPTMTGLLLFLIITFYLVFIMKHSRYNTIVPQISVLLLVGIFGYKFIRIYFNYLFIPELYEYYYNNSMEPIVAYFNLPLSKILFGLGPSDDIGNYTIAAEIGIIRQAFRLGGLFIFFIYGSLLYISISYGRLKIKIGQYHNYIMLKKGIIIVGIWALSLVHYEPALSQGVVQLIGLHLASCMYIHKLIINDKNNSILQKINFS
jgi:hypothetical protein